METFIVRIYRKRVTGQDDIAGLVEHIGSDERIAFRSLADLAGVIRDVCNADADPPDGTGPDRAVTNP